MQSAVPGRLKGIVTLAHCSMAFHRYGTPSAHLKLYSVLACPLEATASNYSITKNINTEHSQTHDAPTRHAAIPKISIMKRAHPSLDILLSLQPAEVPRV